MLDPQHDPQHLHLHHVVLVQGVDWVQDLHQLHVEVLEVVNLGVVAVLDRHQLHLLQEHFGLEQEVDEVQLPHYHQVEVAEEVDDSRMLAGLLQTYCRADELTQIH